MVKLTVSLSPRARGRIDERAAELGLTRSAFVEQLVTADTQKDLERLLEEGYRAASAESQEFAELALPLGWEVIARDATSW